MKIDVLLQLTKGAFRHGINLIGVFVESVTLSVLFVLSIFLVVETYETGQITPSTDYPMYNPVHFSRLRCSYQCDPLFTSG